LPPLDSPSRFAAASVFASGPVRELAAFVESCGVRIEAATLPDGTLLPGLAIADGMLLVDEARLLYPGDILHEAGHIAVSDPQLRARAKFASTGGEEMAAIAWSYAAALAMGLAPSRVFHPAGYKGGGDSLLENFAAGRYFGVPLLQFWGMCVEPRNATEGGPAPYPHMLRWLR